MYDTTTTPPRLGVVYDADGVALITIDGVVYTAATLRERLARVDALEARLAATVERARAICDGWARYWNWLYEKETRRCRGKVAYHLIGACIGAIGEKIVKDEDAPPIP